MNIHRLQEEVDNVIGQKPLISNDNLNRMEYLNLVVKETLRMWPIVPQIFREVDGNGFKINGIDVPKGAIVAVSRVASKFSSFESNLILSLV